MNSKNSSMMLAIAVAAILVVGTMVMATGIDQADAKKDKKNKKDNKCCGDKNTQNNRR